MFEVVKEFLLLDDNISPFFVCAQTVALLWTFLTGISDLLRYKKVRMNLSRAAIFLSVSVMLILYNAATHFIISPALYHPSLGHKIFFGLYLSVSLYNALAGTFYFLYVADALEKPETYSNYFLIVFPFLFSVTYLSENLVFPVYLANFLIIIVELSMAFLTAYFVYLKKAPKIYLNHTLVSVVVASAYGSRIYGIEFQSADILVDAYLAIVYCTVYLLFLQFYFPGFSWKKSKRHNGELDQELPESSVQENDSDELLNEDKNLQKRNLLEGVNLHVIENRVERFLQEKVFLDEEIRLPDFAAYLGLTVHQTSYFMNHYKKSNFPEFINYHRFEEAKNMILKESNLNLLEIGLACGFNSPSSFHRASVKFAGVPPRDLKREIQNKTLAISYELREQLSD
ncbi:helix-turn-helix transcriptional regulator [Leptospira yasudae]|uniref:helix-turn-helix domain-containing protein n=1 Tax=Leptospira yasudae TaxID=2202201 RepID=UPI001C4EEB6A|nr:AraC family transcriptional regulator [Leptospira yasudae]MBW0432314.1 helix-turn-helix transcriptional regulator [Leptospira yasudae]